MLIHGQFFVFDGFSQKKKISDREGIEFFIFSFKNLHFM